MKTVKMKNSMIGLLFALILFNIAGCKHDLIDVETEEDRLVVIFFSSQSLSGSLLKSAATSDEDQLDQIILFGVDDQNQVIDTFLLINPGATATKTISRKIKAFYAIANPSGDMENELETKNFPFPLSYLTDLTGDFSVAPASPFLMGGYGNIIGSGAYVSVDIDLIRTVARIDFSTDYGFEIDSIYVKNTPDAGYVFGREPLSVPPAATWVDYDGIEYLPPTTDTTLYVAESSRLNPVEFTVTGMKSQKKVTYTFSLTKSGQAIDIKRNTRYQVNITPETDTECSINVSIPDWDDKITDIIGGDEPPPPPDYSGGIKILSIGNSYSEDSMCYLFDLLKQLGVDEENNNTIKLACAFIGSGSLDDHVTNANSGTGKDYAHVTFKAGGIITYLNDYYSSQPAPQTIHELIQLEDWDVITLQQNSNNSGISTTYNQDLDDLIELIDENATNPNYKLGWHMTWAYSQQYCENTWVYGRSQLNMYNSICDAVQEKILLKKDGGDFDFIIPTGTAIQNAREYYGDNISRDGLYGNGSTDGSHLNNLGRYIAAAMWVKTITGYDVANLGVPYTVSGVAGTTYIIDQPALDQIVQSVNAAYSSPFVITPITP